ncbi:MAG: glycosyltransferase [Planctomycetia bacterium]|nr:glycosyltransferase [Planctomycetia bacterium]
MTAPGPQDAYRSNSVGSRKPTPDTRTTPPPPHFPAAVAAHKADEPAPSDHDLTVIVPAYNEELRLPATLEGLAEYLNRWGIDYRVLVVDDGSSDGTAQLTGDFGARFSTISQQNAGKGAAVRNGMLQATGRVIAFTDADLPYDLDSLRAAYGAILDGPCEVVFGARDLKESSVRAPRRFLRTLAHWVFRSAVQFLISRQVTDTQCGLKIFSRRAALEIFSRTTINGFAFDAEVVYLTRRLELPFIRVPVTLINEYASTISLSRHAIPMLLDVIGLRWRALRGDYDLAPVALPVAADSAPAARERSAA